MFSAIKPFLELCRVSNLPTVWTNVLVAIVLTGSEFSWVNFLILCASHSFFYSGGMCLNDVCDVAIDRIKKPFRPIPSGKVSIKNAYMLTTVLFALSLAFLLLSPYQRAIYAGFLLLLVIIAYDKFHKAHSLSVILMATCRLMVFVVSALAVTGTVGLFVVIAAILQFLYVLVISLVARHENSRKNIYHFPVVPAMIACISLLDGIVLALLASFVWLAAGIGGAILTLMGQKYLRGD